MIWQKMVLINGSNKKLGRYWEQAKGWFFRKMWPFKTKEGREEEVSKMRASSESIEECQRDREDLPLPGNGQLPMWDLNLQT